MGFRLRVHIPLKPYANRTSQAATFFWRTGSTNFQRDSLFLRNHWQMKSKIVIVKILMLRDNRTEIRDIENKAFDFYGKIIHTDGCKVWGKFFKIREYFRKKKTTGGKAGLGRYGQSDVRTAGLQPIKYSSYCNLESSYTWPISAPSISRGMMKLSTNKTKRQLGISTPAGPSQPPANTEVTDFTLCA